MGKIMLTIVLLCNALFGFSQSKQVPLVKVAVAELHQAMIDANGEVLGRIVVDSLNYGHSTGMVEGKQQFISRIVSGQSGWVTIDIKDQVITISGKTAIVRHILHATTDDNNKPGEVNLRVMQVWQKDKGGWKLFGRQAMKM
ncbi:MAG: nuclear transport factor 2 family protein [Chitinophagaceae bacterium]|nr:MAG: nuclear transport factor 2 family protein [Chitinophagaceae bacterium]